MAYEPTKLKSVFASPSTFVIAGKVFLYVKKNYNNLRGINKGHTGGWFYILQVFASVCVWVSVCGSICLEKGKREGHAATCYKAKLTF